MGAATYIGRVGGLAVALGVGTAIATGQGVATADDTNNSTAPNTSTGGSTSTDSTSTNPTTGPTTGASTIESTEPSNTTQTPRLQTTSTQTTTSSTTSTTVAEGVVVSAQTNTGTSSTTGSTEPTHAAEPTAEPSQTSTPTETAAPQPTQTTEPKAPTKSQDAQEVSTPPSASKSSNESGAFLSVAKPSAKASAPKVEPFADPATNIRQPDKVAVFADARALAAAGPTNVSPTMAAQVTGSEVTEPAPPASPPDRFTAVANVVSSVINWVLNPLAGTSPTTPAQPPLMWGLLAFARREFENFFNTLGGRSGAERLGAAADHQPRTRQHGDGRLRGGGGCRDCQPAVPTVPQSAGEPVDAVRQLGDGRLHLRRPPDACQHVHALLGVGHGRRDHVGQRHSRRPEDDRHQRAPGAHRGRRYVQRPELSRVAA